MVNLVSHSFEDAHLNSWKYMKNHAENGGTDNELWPEYQKKKKKVFSDNLYLYYIKNIPGGS